ALRSQSHPKSKFCSSFRNGKRQQSVNSNSRKKKCEDRKCDDHPDLCPSRYRVGINDFLQGLNIRYGHFGIFFLNDLSHSSQKSRGVRGASNHEIFRDLKYDPSILDLARGDVDLRLTVPLQTSHANVRNNANNGPIRKCNMKLPANRILIRPISFGKSL